MKIIKPEVKVLIEYNHDSHIAKCARTCYRSSKNDDGKRLINDLKTKKHFSMFRHASYYFIIPTNDIYLEYYVKAYINCPYVDYIMFSDYTYFATNGQFIIDHDDFYETYKDCEIDITDNNNIDKIHIFKSNDLLRYTFRVVTQISTSRELNRVSPNNIAEQSTRYVYEDGTLCAPWWLIINNNNMLFTKYRDNSTLEDYIEGCDQQFNRYKRLVDKGMERQDARGVLPLDTATVCIYTYSIKEWRRIIDQRYYGTTGKPHENAKIIASMIRNELIKLDYDFRD